jgi:hypothetical protein
MRGMTRLGLLSGMALLTGCATASFSERPCPRVTDFPASLQRDAAREMVQEPPKPALERMLDAMAADRAFNRAVCP